MQQLAQKKIWLNDLRVSTNFTTLHELRIPNNKSYGLMNQKYSSQRPDTLLLKFLIHLTFWPKLKWAPIVFSRQISFCCFCFEFLRFESKCCQLSITLNLDFVTIFQMGCCCRDGVAYVGLWAITNTYNMPFCMVIILNWRTVMLNVQCNDNSHQQHMFGLVWFDWVWFRRFRV